MDDEMKLSKASWKNCKKKGGGRFLRIQDLEIFNLPGPNIQYITDTVHNFKFVPYQVRKKYRLCRILSLRIRTPTVNKAKTNAKIDTADFDQNPQLGTKQKIIHKMEKPRFINKMNAEDIYLVTRRGDLYFQ
jgi:hypothetical protein